MTAARRGYPALARLLLVLLLAGCAVRLAPQHEEAINRSLLEAYQSTEAFWSRMETGNAADRAFTANADFYAETLAMLRTAELLAGSRPQPGTALLERVGRGAAAGNVAAEILRRLVASFVEMRDSHAEEPFLPEDVPLWRGVLAPQFAAALQYEMALDRE